MCNPTGDALVAIGVSETQHELTAEKISAAVYPDQHSIPAGGDIKAGRLRRRARLGAKAQDEAEKLIGVNNDV